MKPWTEAAIDMARGAGAILVEAYGQKPDVSRKGTIDLVTNADRASEAFILSELHRRFPAHAVLAEESGAGEQQGDFRWLIDPLDGTVNFAHGLPHFSVLLALEERQQGGAFETVSAVSYDPLRNELFVAERGQGATLNGKPIRVSQTARLIDSVLATGFAYERLFREDDNHPEFCRLNLLSQGVRRNGSAGLDLAYVACGRLDGYWESGLNPWDVAGGVLLVREAGGTATAVDGGPFTLAQGTVAAANPELHEVLVAAVRSARSLPANSREGLEAFLPAEVRAEIARRKKRLE